MKTISEQIETLEKKTVESTYIQQATSNTYQLQKEKIYLICITSVDSQGDTGSLNAWFVATGRTSENSGIVQRIVGSNYGCTLNGFAITITHNYNSLVSVTEL